jgi:hypothetical protein
MSTLIVGDDAPAVNDDGERPVEATGPGTADERWWASNAPNDESATEASDFDRLIVEMHDFLYAIAPCEDELAWRNRTGDYGHEA